jgi:hypothetical protein
MLFICVLVDAVEYWILWFFCGFLWFYACLSAGAFGAIGFIWVYSGLFGFIETQEARA